MTDGNPTNGSHTQANEIRLNARPVSRGIAIGRVTCLYGDNRQFYRIPIAPNKIEREVRRFRSAHTAATKQLDKYETSFDNSANSAAIFDMHRAILEDSTLSERIEDVIRTRAVNAEWAVKVVTDEYIAKYRAIPDEHFRDRYIDVEDVAEKLQNALGGGRKAIRIAKDSIIAVKELRPSTLAEIGPEHINAIVTEHGGWTSHTFIVARELSIPAVTGVKKLMRRVKTGDIVIIDGFEGKVVLNPDPTTLKKYQDESTTASPSSIMETAPTGEIRTLDGREVKIRANFDIPAGFRRAKSLGARGIGLFRSEYLFNRSSGFPREAEQVKVYREIANFAGKDRVRVRTFDLSVGQLTDQTTRREPNPALGLRGVRLGLSLPNQLRTQIRALLQASVGREIDIIVPMVSGVDEIRSVKKIIDEESEALRNRDIEIGSPRLGAMIELPSAVLTISAIMDEVDCVCLGTNDLVQYMLGVDRDNEGMSAWFRSLHPSIMLAIKMVVEAAQTLNKPAIICGEMAGSPFYVPVLIGLGATELSMNVNSILPVRKVISQIAFEETRELTSRVMACRTSDDIESGVYDFINERWKHIFPPDLLKYRRT